MEEVARVSTDNREVAIYKPEAHVVNQHATAAAYALRERVNLSQ
jgi:hypothetical protein